MTGILRLSSANFKFRHEGALGNKSKRIKYSAAFAPISDRSVKFTRGAVASACLVVAACDNSQTTNANKLADIDNLADVKANLAFTCVHKKIPAPDPEPDLLFNDARWLQKNNVLKQDKLMNAEIERLYRIAAEHGHYKANVNLQNGSRQGLFELSAQEHIRLSQALIDRGLATGYYLIGIYLQRGSAGLRQDQEMSLRYIRMAADHGSADAQEYLGNRLLQAPAAWDAGWQMIECAAQQGHPKAAQALAMKLKLEKKYPEAIRAFQLGVAAGNESSASFLRHGFLGQPKSDALYLAQQEDLERAERYTIIWRILARYSYAHPKVPEINEIVPLPPAPLPEWDGKLQWLEERLANIPPEKPTEELIKRLADEKKLEPATGKPMPGAAGFD
ncbi:DUF6396 domain-containing protein [Pseudomonas sp. HR96]|uniref:SEL1-like repeat protein n=1 Tax=Pseudomonas sp. HR96 TaxID=1027966 RepID=UPI002A764D5D|nr:DUF6396 domain-containing protein [Pseudomonas sp. HR96]WPP01095.1 DUF6396 domain-containing protein [Pseudomonas sp. HR96]